MRSDWFDEVVAYVRDKATEAVFPGDPDPVYEALEKLTTKLFSECHNDGKLGVDGCATCRAHRTEVAERETVQAAAVAAEAVADYESMEVKYDLAEAEKEALGEALTASEAAYEAAVNTSAGFKAKYEETLVVLDKALAERGAAQRVSTEAAASLAAYDVRLQELSDKLSASRTAAQALNEVLL